MTHTSAVTAAASPAQRVLDSIAAVVIAIAAIALVGLVLGVRDGTQIPELCKLMQARVRELLEEHLGTCDLAGVSIEVAEIRSRKKPVAEEPA